ncbi:MAG: OmpA family protein [Thermoleophilaceae bacterium]|nr:OmpA family protein [Thermoleophilaceae bacterium]
MGGPAPWGRSLLRPAGGRLRQCAAIRVEGHTDAKGDPAYNQRLSLRRAQSVRRWLLDSGGLEAGRVAVRGFGETRPVAPNTRPDGSDDPGGRRLNRRVVIGVDLP